MSEIEGDTMGDINGWMKCGKGNCNMYAQYRLVRLVAFYASLICVIMSGCAHFNLTFINSVDKMNITNGITKIGIIACLTFAKYFDICTCIYK